MQFKVGDYVVHPVFGVGDIVKIEKKRFSEAGARLYYKIALTRSTIWIPVEKAQSTIGLRLVTARRDLAQYRALLKSPPVLLTEVHPQRRYTELTLRLKEGSFPNMCELVRDLTALSWQKPLGVAAKTLLRKAQEKLYLEWALAAGISVPEATNEINTLLNVAQEAAVK